jgi:hypothetical protein
MARISTRDNIHFQETIRKLVAEQAESLNHLQLARIAKLSTNKDALSKGQFVVNAGDTPYYHAVCELASLIDAGDVRLLNAWFRTPRGKEYIAAEQLINKSEKEDLPLPELLNAWRVIG